MNGYFTLKTRLARLTIARAEQINAALERVEQGFDQLPDPDALRTGRANFGVDTGPVNKLRVQLDPKITEYSDGMVLRVQVGQSNTGPATLSINGMAPMPVTLYDGTEMQPGDLVAGDTLAFVHSGGRFYLDSPARSILAETREARDASTTAAAEAGTARDEAVVRAERAYRSRTQSAASASAAQAAQEAAAVSADKAGSHASVASTAESGAVQARSQAQTARDQSVAARDASRAARDAAAVSADQASSARGDVADMRQEVLRQYLGSRTSNPTTDLDGNALRRGALFYHTGRDRLRVYDGSAWIDAALDASAFVTLPDADDRYVRADGSSSNVQPLMFANKEPNELVEDGQISFDSSRGIIVHRTNTNTVPVEGTYTVLDTGTVRAGDGVQISHLAAGISNVEKVTIGHGNVNAAHSVEGNGGTVVSGLQFDKFGHVTGRTMTDLDGRFVRTDVHQTKQGGLNVVGEVKAASNFAYDRTDGPVFMDVPSAEPWIVRHNNGWSARIEPGGTKVSFGNTVITTEKGDGRYLMRGGDTSAGTFNFTGQVKIDQHGFNTALRLHAQGEDAAQLEFTFPGSSNFSIDNRGNGQLEVRNTSSNTQLARFDYANNQAHNNDTVITRRKGDKRYSVLGTDSQRYYDRTGSRSKNTTYRNGSSRTMMISVRCQSNATPKVSHNGSNWITVGHSGGGSDQQVVVVVPPWHYYRIDGGNIETWAEMT